VNVQHFEVYAGENRTLTPIYARDSANAVVSLASKTIDFRVGRSPRAIDSTWPIFTKTGTMSAPAGTFSVAIAPADTQYLQGDYEYQAVTTDGSGNLAVVTVGRFRVRPYIEA